MTDPKVALRELQEDIEKAEDKAQQAGLMRAERASVIEATLRSIGFQARVI